METIYGSCNKIIKYYRDTARHVRTVHEKLKPFECAVCKRYFSAKQVLMKHYMTAHKVVKQNKEIKPVNQGKGPVYEANNHMQDGKKYTFEDHITANPDGTFTCIVETNDGWGSCNKIIKNFRHAIRHIQTVHEKLKPYECALCKRRFWTKQVLMRHYENIHDVEKQSFEIEPNYEGNQLAVINSVYEDRITANPDGTFTCIVETIYGSCNKIIKHYRHATRHVQTVHEKLKPFECAVCKRGFSRKQELMRHYENIHDKEKQSFEIEPVHEEKQLEEIETDNVVIDSVYELKNHVEKWKKYKHVYKYNVTSNPDHGKEIKPQEIESVHEEKEFVDAVKKSVEKWEKETTQEYVTANPDKTFQLEVFDEEIKPGELEPVNDGKQLQEIESIHKVKQPTEIESGYEEKQSKEIEFVHEKQLEESTSVLEEKKSKEIKHIRECKQPEKVEPAQEIKWPKEIETVHEGKESVY